MDMTLTIGAIFKLLSTDDDLFLQLLAFQSCMYSSLQDRYQARGTQSVTHLEQCQLISQENMEQLDTVRGQLETMLTLMLVFLNKSPPSSQLSNS